MPSPSASYFKKLALNSFKQIFLFCLLDLVLRSPAAIVLCLASGVSSLLLKNPLLQAMSFKLLLMFVFLPLSSDSAVTIKAT